MSDPVTADQLSALLNERLEVGLGPRSAPTTPGAGFSVPSPHVGGTEQGTFSGGVAKAFVSDLSSVPVSSPPMSMGDSKTDLPGLSARVKAAIEPVCLLLADPAFLNDHCCGTIGKAGKLCTKHRDMTGDTTCGTKAHVKKATMQEGHI
jgi:hypothetical protein